MFADVRRLRYFGILFTFIRCFADDAAVRRRLRAFFLAFFFFFRIVELESKSLRTGPQLSLACLEITWKEEAFARSWERSRAVRHFLGTERRRKR